MGAVSAGWFCIPTVQHSEVADIHLQPLPPPAGEEDALVTEVRQMISDLEDLALRLSLDSSGLSTVGNVDPEVTRRANDLKLKLQRLIEKPLGKDSARVGELLALNNSFTSTPPVSSQGTLASALTPADPPVIRRVLRDQGVWLTVDIPPYNREPVSANHYNGFNYGEFYKFIIKFFEGDDQAPDEKAAASEVLKWWNWYLSGSGSALAITNASPDMFFHGLPPPEQPHLHRQSGRRSRSCGDNTELAHLVNTPSFD